MTRADAGREAYAPVPADVETRPGPGATAVRDDAVSRSLRTPHRLLTPVI